MVTLSETCSDRNQKPDVERFFAAQGHTAHVSTVCQSIGHIGPLSLKEYRSRNQVAVAAVAYAYVNII